MEGIYCLHQNQRSEQGWDRRPTSRTWTEAHFNTEVAISVLKGNLYSIWRFTICTSELSEIKCLLSNASIPVLLFQPGLAEGCSHWGKENPCEEHSLFHPHVLYNIAWLLAILAALSWVRFTETGSGKKMKGAYGESVVMLPGSVAALTLPPLNPFIPIF